MFERWARGECYRNLDRPVDADALRLPHDDPDLWFGPSRLADDRVECRVVPSWWPKDGVRHGEPASATVSMPTARLLESLEHFSGALDLLETLPVDEGNMRFETLVMLALPPFSPPGSRGGLILGDAHGALSVRFSGKRDSEGPLDLEATVIGPVVWQATFPSWVSGLDLERLADWLGGHASDAVGPTASNLVLKRTMIGEDTQLVLRPCHEPGVRVTHGELQDAVFVFRPGEISTACDWLRGQADRADRA